MEAFNILVSDMYNMSDIMNSKWDLHSSMSELESLGLETPRLKEGNLVNNIEQMLLVEYKSMLFTD